MWIHERFDIGRPRTDLSEYEPAADGTDPADLPTMGALWCLRSMFGLSFFATHLGWEAAEEGLQGLR
jgi:hypothetical protein